jgi:large subunit ribosomal protein L7/L12
MANLQKLVDDLSQLTVLEAADLAKMLEEKWGVSAAAAVAVAAGPGAAAAAPVEEKTEFTVMLTSHGEKKIEVIKEVRAHRPGAQEAKELVEAAPKAVKEGEQRRSREGQGSTRKGGSQGGVEVRSQLDAQSSNCIRRVRQHTAREAGSSSRPFQGSRCLEGGFAHLAAVRDAAVRPKPDRVDGKQHGQQRLS